MYPKRYEGNAAPPAILELVGLLLPGLLQGEHPALAALRSQFESARVERVELTGPGFFVEFSVSPSAPQTEPSFFAGGDAEITIEGARQPAGCVLHVKDGRLNRLEGYTYEGEWPEDARVLKVEHVFPIVPGKAV